MARMTLALDLPMKALVWVDAQAQVWLDYDDPVCIVRCPGGTRLPGGRERAQGAGCSRRGDGGALMTELLRPGADPSG